MEIPNPRRVLAVTLEDQSQVLSRVLKDLTGTHPEPTTSTPTGPSLAGTTHLLPLKTAYYTTSLPIWLDLISDPEEWSFTFLSPEAKEVLEVLGGIAVVFPVDAAAADASRALVREVGRVVREGLGGWSWDGVSLAIGVGEAGAQGTDEWEELSAESGLEFVHVRGGEKDQGKNEFGEKMGIARVLEALESNDWDQVDTGELDSDFDDDETGKKGKDADEDLDPESLEFGFDRTDFEGLKKAIWGLDQDDKDVTEDAAGASASPKTKEGKDEENPELDEKEVEKLEDMMRKLQAVRDMSAGLPEEQRKRLAARAVGDVMKDL